jgi:transposase InsO family protein
VNVYPFIDAEKKNSTTDGRRGGNVKWACELLKVSRSAYYADAAVQAAGGPARARQDAVLTEKIIQFHDESRGTYGSPRVHADLLEAGLKHGRKRVARLMREAGIYGKTRRRWVTTTVADPDAPSRPDLIRRDFRTDATALNKRWCGDITYIQTWEGFAYLATVIDIASRRVVGWAIADTLHTDLVELALRNAVATRHPDSKVIFHADRGTQYTSKQLATAATAFDVRLSVGRRGQCWDNAVSESFFATLKNELTEHQPWPTHKTLRTAVFNYIEGWYNTRRRHSSLGQINPAAFEAGQQPIEPPRRFRRLTRLIPRA